MENKKSRKFPRYNDQCLKIVENVFQYCKAEGTANKLLAGRGNLNAYRERAADYTGVPITVFNSYIKEESFIDTDLSFRLTIRKTLTEIYSKAEIPTSKSVYEVLKSQFGLVPFDRFLNQLYGLGYEEVSLKSSETDMIMEKPEITFERFHYLKQMRKARCLKEKIYYIGVRIYDPKSKYMVPFKSKHVDKLNLRALQADRLLIYYVISKDGIENILYSYCYEPAKFNNWVLNIIVPMLQPSSLVVIDKNPFSGIYETEIITRYHPKKDMLHWLNSHNLPCKPTMRKPELYELIEKCSVRVERKNLENILISNGYDVLLLPDHLDKMTPTDLLWRHVNQKLQCKEFTLGPKSISIVFVKEFIEDTISSIKTETWEEYDQNTKHTEDQLFVLDTQVEYYLEEHELN